MNLGYRYVFPVLPFVFISVGLAAGGLWRWRMGKGLVLALGAALCVETLAAYPNFIAFFNAAFVSHRFELLGDSNLDWGQNLPLLADWQRKHPQDLIYLDYFGGDDPNRFGSFIDIHDYSAPPPALPPRDRPAVVAVSANYIQLKIYNLSALIALGVDLRRKPIAVLGGTIYLYAVPPAAGK
jgi:hypothetical protein